MKCSFCHDKKAIYQYVGIRGFFFCSKKCSKQFWISGQLDEKLPPFPIPKEIAFLPRQGGNPPAPLYSIDAIIKGLKFYNLGHEIARVKSLTKELVAGRKKELNAYYQIFTKHPEMVKEKPNKWMFKVYKPVQLLVGPALSRKDFSRVWGSIDEIVQRVVQFYDKGQIDLAMKSLAEIVEKLLDDTEYLKASTQYASFFREFIVTSATGKFPYLATAWKLEKEMADELFSKPISLMRVTWYEKTWSWSSVFDNILLGDDNFQGLETLMLKQGALLYRGQGGHRPATPKRSTAWFAFTAKTAMGYLLPDTEKNNHNLHQICSNLGNISLFQVRKDTLLMNLASATNIEMLREQLATELGEDDEIYKAFDVSWSVDENTGEISRVSHILIDVKWANWLCSKGYLGYVATATKGLLPEVFFCDWNAIVKFRGTYDSKEVLQTEFCKEPFYSTNTEFYAQ